MSKRQKYLAFSVAIFLFLIIAFAAVVLDSKITVSDITEYYSCTDSFCSQESESTESIQAENSVAVYYDGTQYENEIKNFADVVLPFNDYEDSKYTDEILFIGDSNTAGLSSFGFIPLQNVLGKKSMGIQSVCSSEFVWFSGYYSPVTIVKAVSLLKPRRIIINFGTNNTIGTSVRDFKSIYKVTLREISKAYPYSDIIVAAVLPVARYRENPNIKMQTINNFNLALAQLCREEGYKFLNTAEVFKNETGGYMNSALVASDGIHLNNKGFNTLLNYIDTHKLITKDTRPPRGTVPIRINPPKVESEASSVFPGEIGEEVIIPPTVSSSEEILASSQASSPVQSSSSEPEKDTSSQEEEIIYDPFL